MAHIKSVEINEFRGIRHIDLTDFSDINILTGDNNCGKTTILEAIQLLFVKAQLSSVKNVINQRTVLNSNSSFYTSFIKMFNTGLSTERLSFDISANSNIGALRFEMKGQEKNITGEDALKLSAMSKRQKEIYKRSSDFIPETVKMFSGNLINQNGNKTTKSDIKCTSMDNGLFGSIEKKEVYYLSSFGHLRYDLLQNIVDNPDYKKLAVDILRQFDEDIEDICYTKADDGTFLETVITKKGDNMPFSVYGDGIKKILFILNRLFDAENSILLIDEIETGLHRKYFDILFPVVIALAKKLNVQLFIATHSLEAIDSLLKYGDYENSKDKNDPIRVITLKKDGNKTISRNLTGRHVSENREAFNFEVRL